MSEKPAWMEDWHVDKEGDICRSDSRPMLLRNLGPLSARPDMQRLAAAAPALVRALLATELVFQEGANFAGETCGVCVDGGPKLRDHGPTCPIDAALTLAGFPTAESRDAAREMMRSK